MANKAFRPRIILFFLYFSLGIVSCFNESGEARPTENNTQPAIPLTATLPFPMTSERIREETLSPTFCPTAAPSPTKTNTLAPTYSPAQAQLLIAELLLYNSGCQLPCWWGFIPGKTSWQTAQDLLARIAKEIYIPFAVDEPEFFADVVFSTPEDISSYDLTHVYRVRDGLISMIEVDPGQVSVYSLSSILTSYGLPSEVWIWTFREKYQNFFPFDLVLFYPEQGIMVRFDTKAIRVGDRVQGCFKSETALAMALWSPDTIMSFLDVASITRNIDLHEWGDPIALKKATGLELDDFYQQFKDPNNTLCLETAADLWPPP
ncbi:MAG: hypothetical protein GTO18_00010 [Anaerolineales bacterium]|nr:hypothetical protein [Anaerolineales bacterium]